LIGSGVALLVLAVLGIAVFSRLESNGFDDPGSSSSQARALLDQKFGGAPDIIFLVHAREGVVTDGAAVASGQALAKRLSDDPRLTSVTSFWSTQAPSLESRNHTDALILATVRGNDEQASTYGNQITKDYAHVDTPATTVLIGGPLGTNVGSQVGKDIARAESIAVPLTILLLIIAFGSLVASFLPLSVGVVAIFGALAELFVMTHLVNVSVFAINLVTAMGLGLGIDYALLMVSRFREELARGASVDDAVVATVETAGKTIAFSALTVAVALSAMLVFPVYFLKSFAYGGVGVTFFAALGALFVLPSLLTMLGPRVNAGKVPGINPSRSAAAPFWGRLAGLVMRRPAFTAIPAVVVLLVLAAPILHIGFSTPDERVLPTSAPSHQVGDALRAGFATQPTAIQLVTTSPVPIPSLIKYARSLSRLPGVQVVDSSAGSFARGSATTSPSGPVQLHAPGSEHLVVNTGLAPASGAAQDLVRAVRAVPAPPHTTVYVGGSTATLIDDKDAIGSRLWLAGLIIVVSSFILLFLFTGSLLQPLRALVGNVLTLGATFGVMTWIFQDGHLASVLNFTPTPTNTDMPVLLFCVAFGLSMDYEVFVISRIKELRDHGEPNRDAVVHGLARTGRIVSTAAALLAVSFFAFGTSHVSFIQFFGLGSGLAILLDATVVRGVLLPAVMRVFGEANWYAPGWMRRIHDRFGLRDAPSA
jgi:RND superfamily putative drug exporter